MKVNIGKYPNRMVCDIHTRYMNRKYGLVDWPENSPFENRLEWLEDRVQNVYNIFNWIWFDRRKQKVDIRIDKQDTWSMDSTLAPVILPMLVQLKDTKHGAPNVDPEDVPQELRPTAEWKKAYEGDGTTDPKFFERWDWVLDEMIWAFEQKCRDDWMEDYDYNKWDQEGAKAHQERMSNGFRLFGKYYESLWD